MTTGPSLNNTGIPVTEGPNKHAELRTLLRHCEVKFLFKRLWSWQPESTGRVEDTHDADR